MFQKPIYQPEHQHHLTVDSLLSTMFTNTKNKQLLRQFVLDDYDSQIEAIAILRLYSKDSTHEYKDILVEHIDSDRIYEDCKENFYLFTDFIGDNRMYDAEIIASVKHGEKLFADDESVIPFDGD